MKLVVPLVSQGELIGVLNLGPRLSEQEYSSDDRKLLDNLAAQAAPALRVAQLVREQEAEAATRQRFEQELEVARLIQQNFLPKELPDLPGWQIAAYYQPAREVGGDFYDFIPLPDGRVGFVVGDVTDKGVPAALVMSATRSVLRASAQRLIEPGEVLERVNEHLVPGHAGEHVRHLPLRRARSGSGPAALRQRRPRPALREDRRRRRRAARARHAARPDARHDLRGEGGDARSPGDSVLLHSDGVVEAHDPDREMFGFPRLKETMAGAPGGRAADRPRALATSRPSPAPAPSRRTTSRWSRSQRSAAPTRRPPSSNGRVLAEFELASEPGNEREAMARVEDAVAGLGMEPARLERLKTAVAEATMNAMEHGNEYRADRPVSIRVIHAAATPFSVPDHRPRRGRRAAGAAKSPTSRRSSKAARSRAAGACS